MSVFILQNIQKSYVVNKKTHVVLKDVSLAFPNKGLVSIVGKSGSGKSTLLNIMMGIEKPTRGKILFKGKDLTKFNDKAFSKFHLYGASTVFQHYNLFDDLTAVENVILPLEMQGFSRQKAVKLAEEQFEAFHIKDLMTRKTQKLSGGEKQRVAILRSVITHPNVILCDEPTGALDFKNSREIMEILKNLSKKILVVMVSHNKQLVEKYSDKIITIQDGRITETSRETKDKFLDSVEKRGKAYKSNWIKLFLFKNLRKNLGKNIFTLVSCLIGFVSVLLCVGFLFGSEKSYQEAMSKNLSMGNATVFKIESVVISNSPLTYQKTVRPTLLDVDTEFKEFKTIQVEENLSYFISGSASCVFDGSVYSNFQMIPLLDPTLKTYGSDLLIAGKGIEDNFDEIIVNEEFVKLLGKDLLNQTIIFRNTAPTNYDTYDTTYPFVKDEFIIEKPMKIAGIIREFPFLNTPKIYYSYKGAKALLKGQNMENLSRFLDRPYTYYDYLINCEPDDAVSSYSRLIFLKDLSESEMFFKRISKLKNSTLEVTSSVLQIKETYQTFISSFSKTLFVFSIIVFIGINFILGMISLSSFLQNRKNIAIMTCLGARNHSIYALHLFENYFVLILAFILAIGFSILGQHLLNPILYSKFALSTLIDIPFLELFGIKFGLVILFLFVAILMSTIFTLVPMLIYRHGFLVEELRDE